MRCGFLSEEQKREHVEVNEYVDPRTVPFPVVAGMPVPFPVVRRLQKALHGLRQTGRVWIQRYIKSPKHWFPDIDVVQLVRVLSFPRSNGDHHIRLR